MDINVQKAEQKFCYSDLETKSSTYADKVDAGTATTRVLHSLAWSVDELQRLIESAHKSCVEVQVIIEVVEDDVDMIRANVARKISDLKDVLIEIVRGVFWYHRTIATHVLVIMISTESRNRKPYSLPVQCIPYASLKDDHIRSILNNVVKEMSRLGMKVAGIITIERQFQLTSG
ncbi:hypothetical protein SPONN_2620 [uncultured Candidatus Thioglobus sp.]|nr:hypothetical protein SPONN_2620 [uncultured Candidatus Thioglobus sp.]